MLWKESHERVWGAKDEHGCVPAFSEALLQCFGKKVMSGCGEPRVSMVVPAFSEALLQCFEKKIMSGSGEPEVSFAAPALLKVAACTSSLLLIAAGSVSFNLPAAAAMDGSYSLTMLACSCWMIWRTTGRQGLTSK